MQELIPREKRRTDKERNAGERENKKCSTRRSKGMFQIFSLYREQANNQQQLFLLVATY